MIPDPAIWLDRRPGIVDETHLRVSRQRLAHPALDLDGMALVTTSVTATGPAEERAVASM